MEENNIKRFCAVFALFHNEKEHLPIWIDYYGKNFGYENLYVLDHDTTDGSTDILEELGVNHIYKHHTFIHDDGHFMTRTLQEMQEELLQSYRYIINPDADEFLLPDPDKYENLRDYIVKMKSKKVATSTGYEVIHDRFHEPVLDWSKPLLAQRKHWITLRTYNKPIILGEPRSWSHGKHELIGGGLKPPADPELILCHIHRIDYETTKKRTEYRYYRKWNSGITPSTDDPNRKIDEKFDEYFDNIAWHNSRGAQSELQKIDDKWKMLL